MHGKKDKKFNKNPQVLGIEIAARHETNIFEHCTRIYLLVSITRKSKE